MSTLPIDQVVKYETEECITCGVSFAVTRLFQKMAMLDHRIFYCPSGHSQAYTAKTEAELLRIEKGKLLAKIDQMDAELRDTKSELKRQARRVLCGVCPHCHRTFKQLKRHIKCKHPELLD